VTTTAWDTEGQNVVVGNIDTPFLATYQNTKKVDALNMTALDWLFRVTARGDVPITRVDVLVQYSTLRTPNEATDADWTYFPFADVTPATGVTVLRDQQFLRDVPGPAPFTLGFRTLVLGRWMRIKFKSTGGDPTNSKTTITAYRRLSGGP